MRIRFWGTRGSIPVPGRHTTRFGGNTTCLELSLAGGTRIIVDAGTGIRPLGEALQQRAGPLEVHLLITHIHWDHIMGFPFFAPAFNPEATIFIDGFPTCMKGLRVPFDNRMGDGFFPIRFDDLKAQIAYLDRLNRGTLEIGGVRIDSVPLQHPQGGFGFRFREGARTLVFITDNELTEEAWAGRHPGDYIRFCEGADLLIHDAQYTPRERAERRGWGHSDYEATVRMALQAGVGRLVLFHHDPARTDAGVQELEERCREMAKEAGSDMEIHAAREESEIPLEPEDSSP